MRIDGERIERLADVIATLPEDVHGLDFYSFRVGDRDVPVADMYPPLDHPAAIEFFFFVMLHNHGFWHGNGRGYLQPLVGWLDGRECKGSDLLWKMCLRALNADSCAFEPKRLSQMSAEGLARLFSDDHGSVRFPDMRERLALTREYGRRMCEEVMTPGDIVAAANRSPTGQVLAEFLRILSGTAAYGDVRAQRGVAGFDSDQFRKKAMLLAMALTNRPERFLRVTDEAHWKPIVDYHVMRVALRTGLVVMSDAEAASNAARAWVNKESERRVRELTYLAVDRVMSRSKRSLAVVDHAFWSARRFCPEMSPPKCDDCTFVAACAKRTELFQPVYRTTDY